MRSHTSVIPERERSLFGKHRPLLLLYPSFQRVNHFPAGLPWPTLRLEGPTHNNCPDVVAPSQVFQARGSGLPHFIRLTIFRQCDRVDRKDDTVIVGLHGDGDPDLVSGYFESHYGARPLPVEYFRKFAWFDERFSDSACRGHDYALPSKRPRLFYPFLWSVSFAPNTRVYDQGTLRRRSFRACMDLKGWHLLSAILRDV
mmetsp:Transcript_20054/g.40642  ORF Transcript_20054/g.40642 Transcript_20054/m.40642 type:complete len:200 (-) Transcript_20054:34-633(-)